MARIKGGMNAKKKHKRVLKLAKGYRGARNSIVLQNSLLCVRWKSPIQVENRKRDSSDSFGLLVLMQQLE